MKAEIKGTIVPDNDRELYEWLGYTVSAPKDIHAAIAKAGGGLLEVDINSEGGDVFAGQEIYTALRQYGNILLRVVGLAASAASVILCAGKNEITPGGMVMVHNISSYARGDHRAMEAQGDILRKADRALASAYTAKSGMSEEEALAMMERETWLTAQEAVERKLVDRIMFEEPMLAASNAPLLSREARERIRAAMRQQTAGGGLAAASARLEYLKLTGGNRQ